jgi:hypothetical protein
MLRLPSQLIEAAAHFGGPSIEDIEREMRSADQCLTPSALNAQKATRLSFTQMLSRAMIDGRWRLTKDLVEFDAQGLGRLIYQIDFEGHKSTYIARSTPPMTAEDATANENLGLRVGTNRHVWGTLFLGQPSDARIEEEFKIIETRDMRALRAKSDVIGWTPGSRSARIFDEVVNALAEGQQPSASVIKTSGYLIRNGGFLGAGRFGTLSFDGIPPDHPLKPPYFADLFSILLLREVGVDLVNSMAAARSGSAIRLSDDIATYFGVGNASGLGMCVTIQRKPQWLSTWMLVREFCLARAKLMCVVPFERDRLLDLIERAIAYYDFTQPDSEEFMVSHAQIASNLRRIRSLLTAKLLQPSWKWKDLADQVTESFDVETAELLNALLIEIYPEFADNVASYIPFGMNIERDYSPEIPVSEFRRRFLSKYSWELQQDLTNSAARRHFWYRSAENGETRRGERVIDPHEEFEGFTDNLGIIKQLASVVAAYDDSTPMAVVIADHPELGFAAARVETMADLPYNEVRGIVTHKDFTPASLIRWYLSILGLESTYPLSIRWVPGVLFQGFPLWESIAEGADPDWKFRNVLPSLEKAI